MITALFLPETLGMPMSQTMEEAENNYYKTPAEVQNKDDTNEKKISNPHYDSEEL